MIENFGGTFIYFQAASTYLAVPVATCFLFGIFWKRATPAAALAVMVAGIPLGALIQLWIIPNLFSAELIKQYSLANFYVTGGITQIFCAILMVIVSLFTEPRNYAGIESLMWSTKLLRSPEGEPDRPLWQSVWLWWGVMAVIYAVIYYMWW